MSTCVSKSFRLPSPLKVEEEAPMVSEKQGIVSILRSDSDQTKAAAASLRRTLSADMSSKKWLAQNGFSPMKKIASSEHLPVLAADSSSSSEEGEEEYEGKKELQKPGQHDVWSSILSQKTKEDASNLPPPYVHPLVKRSSSLSEKSLQVCTESLGSETGSDGFSSYQSSEAGDGSEDKEEVQIIQQQQQTQAFDVEEPQLVKNTKKVVSRSFPPPLPSLKRGDGPFLHMHSHRQNGRLVLEAVSVPSINLFHAERQDGRLLLTLLNSPSEEPNHDTIIDPVEDKIEEYPGVFDMFEVEKEDDDDDAAADDYDYDYDYEDEDEDEKEMSIVTVKEPNMTSGVINLHRAALTMKKLMGIQNTNPTWPHKFNKTAKLVEVEVEVEEKQLPQSLPPPQRVARMIAAPPVTTVATSFNAYEYFWRAKPAGASLINPLSHQFPPLENKLSNNPKTRQQQDLVHNLVPSLRGCKEPRRSLLIWEPFCIATS